MKNFTYTVLALSLFGSIGLHATPPSIEDFNQFKDVDKTKTKQVRQTNALHGKWIFKHAQTQIGQEIVYKKPKFFAITIDGASVYGNTDCNGVFGSITVFKETQKIKISNMGGTMMYCQESQENQFAKFLTSVKIYEKDGDKILILKSDKETYTFELTNKKYMDDDMGRNEYGNTPQLDDIYHHDIDNVPPPFDDIDIDNVPPPFDDIDIDIDKSMENKLCKPTT